MLKLFGRFSSSATGRREEPKGMFRNYQAASGVARRQSMS